MSTGSGVDWTASRGLSEQLHQHKSLPESGRCSLPRQPVYRCYPQPEPGDVFELCVQLHPLKGRKWKHAAGFPFSLDGAGLYEPGNILFCAWHSIDANNHGGGQSHAQH